MRIQNWIIGTALIVSLPSLLPIYRKTIKPLVSQSGEVIQDMYTQVKTLTIKAKHELEDIWLEAQYDQIRKKSMGLGDD
jgi:hypothetical protein